MPDTFCSFLHLFRHLLSGLRQIKATVFSRLLLFFVGRKDLQALCRRAEREAQIIKNRRIEELAHQGGCRRLLRGGSSQDEHRCKAPGLRSRLAPQGVYFKSFLSAMQINDIINRLYSYQNQLFLYFLLPSIDNHPYFCYNYVSNSLQIHTERT